MHARGSGIAAKPRAPSPLEVLVAIADRDGVACLDGGGFADRGRSLLAWNPVRRLTIEAGGSVAIDGLDLGANDPLGAIERFVVGETARGRVVVGALSYDLRLAIEPRAGRPPRGMLPLAVLHAYDAFAWHDPRSGVWRGATLPDGGSRLPPARLRSLVPAVEPDVYRERFRRLHGALRDGELYQANLAIPFDGELDGPPAALFARLASTHPVRYGAYLDLGDFQLVVNSPELLFHRRGGRIETRPIKGTRSRGRTPAEDAHLVADLRTSPKERAEHVMIVDLERNDLGRIAVPGSVRVEELASVCSYGTLHHLESTIAAELRPGVGLAEILRATFPGGSISGAPKIRAMHWIDVLETAPREFYTGSIFVAAPDGELVANVAIRCTTIRGGHVRSFAGGGVVVDSTAEDEWRECLLKAEALVRAGRG